MKLRKSAALLAAAALAVLGLTTAANGNYIYGYLCYSGQIVSLGCPSNVQNCNLQTCALLVYQSPVAECYPTYNPEDACNEGSVEYNPPVGYTLYSGSCDDRIINELVECLCGNTKIEGFDSVSSGCSLPF